jgi:imidazolonepropionase-like amidohydrolase
LEAATLSNAKAFGLGGQIGTVQPGKRANLVLLGSSPLESVQAYGSIQGVGSSISSPATWKRIGSDPLLYF